MSESAPAIAARLFDRLRAPAPIDPATGLPVPVNRPILDAIKNGGGSLIGSLFTGLGPMLLPFLTKLLQQYMGQIVAPADGGAAEVWAENRKLADELVAALPQEAVAAGVLDDVTRPVIAALQAFVVALIEALDPKEAAAWLITLINNALNPAS